MQDAVAASAPRLRLGPTGTEVVAASGQPFDALIAQILGAVRRCESDGAWTRLKACERDACHWAYYDTSRNRSRRWCSMQGCGNVLKMRRRAGRVLR